MGNQDALCIRLGKDARLFNTADFLLFVKEFTKKTASRVVIDEVALVSSFAMILCSTHETANQMFQDVIDITRRTFLKSTIVHENQYTKQNQINILVKNLRYINCNSETFNKSFRSCLKN